MMMTVVATLNPLVPSLTEGLTVLGAAAHVVLAVWAVLSVLRARALSFNSQLAYAVVAVIVPLVGPLLTLFMSRRARSSV